MNHHTIPPKIAQALKRAEKERLQTILDNIVVSHPDTFTCNGILHAVAQFMACDDQVSRWHSIMCYTHILKGVCCCW
jgi:hypothetical protein